MERRLAENFVESLADERSSAVEEAVVDLLNVVVVLDDDNLHCRLCGEKDGNHLEGCPVPALEQWLSPLP
jgi:hypothetical protein